MNGMKIGKKIEIATLNLKFLTEQLDLVEQQLKDGTEDLYFRLSHFRKRVAKKDIEKYDQYFFGAKSFKSNDISNNTKIQLYQKSEDLPDNCQKKNPWLKKIYRKIVSSTHPDKFVNFPVVSLKQKYLEIYRKTVHAWKNGHNDILLIAAYESDILVKNPEALEILQLGNKEKNNRLQEIQKLLAYQWYHIPDENRTKTLESYLTKLGYEFTAEEVEKIVHLPRKRKVGTRPKNLRKIKNVK